MYMVEAFNAAQVLSEPTGGNFNRLVCNPHLGDDDHASRCASASQKCP